MGNAYLACDSWAMSTLLGGDNPDSSPQSHRDHREGRNAHHFLTSAKTAPRKMDLLCSQEHDQSRLSLCAR